MGYQSPFAAFAVGLTDGNWTTGVQGPGRSRVHTGADLRLYLRAEVFRLQLQQLQRPDAPGDALLDQDTGGDDLRSAMRVSVHWYTAASPQLTRSPAEVIAIGVLFNRLDSSAN